MILLIPGARRELTINLVPSPYGPLFCDMEAIARELADVLPTEYLEHLASELRVRAEIARRREEQHAAR